MLSTQSGWRLALLATGALALAGCGSDSERSNGTVNFYMTDAPVDEAYAVVLAMTHFEVKPVDGPAFRVELDLGAGEDYRQINLLDFTNGDSTPLVTDAQLEIGDYEWLRIFFDEENSYIQLDETGGVYTLFMPSGAQTGYKAVGGFSVREGEAIDYILDFDLRKSVLEPPGLRNRFGVDRAFLLKPTVRLLERAATGGVDGAVDEELLADWPANAEACAGGDAVYAFEGFDADPLGEGVLPVVSDMVELSAESGAFEYALMFLLPGEYTLALTCSASLDEGEAEDYAENYPPAGLEFSAQVNVTIVAREVKRCDMPQAEGADPC